MKGKARCLIFGFILDLLCQLLLHLCFLRIDMKFKYLMAMAVALFINNAYANTALSSQSNQANANVSQQTGGNYIYAENGKLTFNLEPSLFENRTWKFDQQTDAAVVGFETNLPLKTKNSSDFHVYELAMGYKIYELTENGEMKFVKATTERPPKGGLIYPVYKPNKNNAQTYYVWLPAVVWTVRIVGTVARQVVPPIINRAATSCATNPKCVIAVSVTSAHAAALCAINYYYDGAIRKFLHLPKTVCEKAEEKGWKRKNSNSSSDDNNQLVREYALTVKGYYGNQKLHERCPECSSGYKEFTIGADSESEAMDKIKKKCAAHIGGSYTNEDESSTWYGLTGTVKDATLTPSTGGYVCSGTAFDEEGDFPFSGFHVSIWHEKMSEEIQMVDINDLIVDDFKSNPTPYINENGQVGKELRENIKSSAAIQKKDGTSGTLMASSEPYLDPNSGTVKQDILTVQSNDKPDFISGNGSSNVGSGNGSNTLPAGTNNVSMQTIDRPDLASSAKPAANNQPNGTGVGSSSANAGNSSNGTNGGSQNGSTNGSENGESEKEQGGLDCAGEHKGTLACASLGNVSESDFDGIAIPEKESSANYSADNFLPANGICPAPKLFHVAGKEYQVSYEPICRIASDIRFAVLIAFAVMAALVAFGGLRKS